jgi:hypothetical protein
VSVVVDWWPAEVSWKGEADGIQGGGCKSQQSQSTINKKNKNKSK